jgi:hypothetical protein
LDYDPPDSFSLITVLHNPGKAEVFVKFIKTRLSCIVFCKHILNMRESFIENKGWEKYSTNL